MKIGLLLTSKCNRACSYCDHMTTNSADFDASVDLEHMLDILSLFPKHSYVELSGGEPGLLANLLEIIDGISSLDNVDSIDVLSNGLAYQRYGSDLFKNEKLKSYREHWFSGDFENPHGKHEHVVVLSEDLLDYFFTKIEMFYEGSSISDKRIEFKLFTPKVYYPENRYFARCESFYNYIRHYMTHPKTLEHIQTQLHYIDQYNQLGSDGNYPCYLFPKNVFIDLEGNKIHQCSMAVCESRKSGYDITAENIRKLTMGKLFDRPLTACSKCYKHDAAYSKTELLKRINQNNGW